MIIPWTSWLQTGDTSVIEQNWAAMEKYLDAIDATNPDGLWHERFGDSVWGLAVAGRRRRRMLVATAYWAYDVTYDAADGARDWAHRG